MQTNDNSSLEDFLNNAVAQIRINRGSHHKAARKRGEIFVKIQAQLPGEFMRWVKKQNREWETSNNERGFDYSYPNVYNYIVLYKLYEKYPDTYKEFESEGVAKMYRLAKFILNGRTKEEWVREHGVVGSKRKFKLGNEIRFKGLQHAPVNEQGVVYLFALVSEKLGFRVQGIRSEYPDCMAMKRRDDKKNPGWDPVKIEFEFLSRNFKKGDHPPEECQWIVCWIHNWPECPPQLQVLELRSAMKTFPDYVEYE